MEKENKMGVMPVKQLIISMSLPMMISMLVQALYNVVDSIFVAKISKDALTAVTLAFPMQNLMIALGSGTGVGINALLSRSLGEKKFENSDGAANTGLLLTFFNYLVFLVIGLFFAGSFIHSQTNNPDIAAYGRQYLTIVCCLSFGVFFQITLERLLQSTGKTIYSMITQATGAVINIIFDPLLIFGIGPFPELGVAGAAYATVLGQFIGAAIGLTCNLKFNKEIVFSWKKILHPELETIREIYYVGVPSILMMSIGSIMTYLLNKILIMLSPIATAVFGIYFKLQSFVFMPVFGLNSGVVPIIAYNYGARRPDRIKETFRYAVIYVMSIMAVGFLLFETIPGSMLALFSASDHMSQIGVHALRVLATPFIVAGFCIMCSSVFQALGHGVLSLWVSLIRQIIVLLPSAFILAKLVGLDGVWYSFPIAEIASAALSIMFIRRIMREEVDTLYID